MTPPRESSQLSPPLQAIERPPTSPLRGFAFSRESMGVSQGRRFRTLIAQMMVFQRVNVWSSFLSLPLVGVWARVIEANDETGGGDQGRRPNPSHAGGCGRGEGWYHSTPTASITGSNFRCLGILDHPALRGDDSRGSTHRLHARHSPSQPDRGIGAADSKLRPGRTRHRPAYKRIHGFASSPTLALITAALERPRHRASATHAARSCRAYPAKFRTRLRRDR